MRGSRHFGREATHHSEPSNSRTLGLIRRMPRSPLAHIVLRPSSLSRTQPPGASPLFAKLEMGSVRCRVRKIRRRSWPSAARVRPASVPARTPRGTRTPNKDWTPCRMAWPFVSAGAHAPHSDERLGPTATRGRRTPLVAYAPSLSCAPPTRWFPFPPTPNAKEPKFLKVPLPQGDPDPPTRHPVSGTNAR